jgi:4'-phosphopantetheinyl transferase
MFYDEKIFINNFRDLILEQNEVHVWNFRLEDCNRRRDLLGSLLSQYEIDRVDRFHMDNNKNRFIYSRGLLRILISAYTDIKPSSVNLAYNMYGKPELEKNKNISSIHFNLSYSEDTIYIGFLKNNSIGIDIEFLKPISNFFELAERYFTDSEIRQLKALPKEKQLEGFYTCWTGKEAVIKAIGGGLSIPLKDFNILITPIVYKEKIKYVLHLVNEDIYLESFRSQPNLVGALAVRGKLERTIYWNCQDHSSLISTILK